MWQVPVQETQQPVGSGVARPANGHPVALRPSPAPRASGHRQTGGARSVHFAAGARVPAGRAHAAVAAQLVGRRGQQIGHAQRLGDCLSSAVAVLGLLGSGLVQQTCAKRRSIGVDMVGGCVATAVAGWYCYLPRPGPLRVCCHLPFMDFFGKHSTKLSEILDSQQNRHCRQSGHAIYWV